MSSDGKNSKNIAPFTMFSSSATGGYLDELHASLTGGIEINNLHTDTYGDFRHPPAQGPFTSRYVGGSQHRHSEIGRTTRNEAFRITFENPQSFLFETTSTEITPIDGSPAGTDLVFELDGGGNIQPLDPPTGDDDVWELDGAGNIQPNVPNGSGVLALNKPGRPVFYRDEFAKRPINIRNIQDKTSTSVVTEVSTSAPFTFYAQEHGPYALYRIDPLSSSASPTLVSGTQNAYAVAIDGVNSKIYYQKRYSLGADPNAGYLVRCDFDGANETSIFDQDPFTYITDYTIGTTNNDILVVPEQNKIVFAAEQIAGPWYPGLFAIDLTGSNLTLLSERTGSVRGGYTGIQYSPTQQKVFFRSSVFTTLFSGSWGIGSVDLDGNNETIITTDYGTDYDHDGSLTIDDENETIYWGGVYSSGGSAIKFYHCDYAGTTSGSFEVFDPFGDGGEPGDGVLELYYNPTDSRLYFSLRHNDEADNRLVSCNTDGSDPQVIDSASITDIQTFADFSSTSSSTTRTFVDYVKKGNFSLPREVIHTTGRTSNPGARAAAYSVTHPLFLSNENSVLNVDGDTGNLADYAMPELSSSASAHVFVNRFSSPGDRYTMSRGFLNPIGEEYSAYNANPFRNLNVRAEHSNNLTQYNEQFTSEHHPVNRNPNLYRPDEPIVVSAATSSVTSLDVSASIVVIPAVAASADFVFSGPCTFGSATIVATGGTSYTLTATVDFASGSTQFEAASNFATAVDALPDFQANAVNGVATVTQQLAGAAGNTLITEDLAGVFVNGVPKLFVGGEDATTDTVQTRSRLPYYWQRRTFASAMDQTKQKIFVAAGDYTLAQGYETSTLIYSSSMATGSPFMWKNLHNPYPSGPYYHCVTNMVCDEVNEKLYFSILYSPHPSYYDVPQSASAQAIFSMNYDGTGATEEQTEPLGSYDSLSYTQGMVYNRSDGNIYGAKNFVFDDEIRVVIKDFAVSDPSDENIPWGGEVEICTITRDRVLADTAEEDVFGPKLNGPMRCHHLVIDEDTQDLYLVMSVLRDELPASTEDITTTPSGISLVYRVNSLVAGSNDFDLVHKTNSAAIHTGVPYLLGIYNDGMQKNMVFFRSGRIKSAPVTTEITSSIQVTNKCGTDSQLTRFYDYETNIMDNNITPLTTYLEAAAASGTMVAKDLFPPTWGSCGHLTGSEIWFFTEAGSTLKSSVLTPGTLQSYYTDEATLDCVFQDQKDNANVQHAIPQSDIQYAWITGSSESRSWQFDGNQKTKDEIIFNSSSVGFSSPLNGVYLDEGNNTQDFDFTGSVYGYNTWKQIRGGELKLSRHYRENSILAAANASGRVSQFSEPAIVAKHKPIEHVIGIDESSEDYVVKSPYGNQLTRHSNDELNKLFSFARSDHGTTYTHLKNNYINRSIDDPANPVKRFVSMTYGETVFPRSANAFRNKVRVRGNYTEVAGTGNNGYDRLYGTQNTMYSSTGTRSATARNSQGIVDITLAFDPMKTDGASSFTSNNVGELNKDTDTSMSSSTAPTASLDFFETNHAHVASTDTDYNERLIEEMSGKTRWYDSYEAYQNNSRGLLPEASVIPEFRISEHMDFYIDEAAGNFRADNKKFLTLLGHEASSSAEARTSVSFGNDFESTLLTSDEIENFEKIKKDHLGHSRPKKLTLKAAGVKKLLPYNGFYPDTRTVQLGNLLSQSIAPNIQGYLTLEDNPTKAEQFLEQSPVHGSAAILKTIASPGILYNTTKAGLAVGYPLYTTRPTAMSVSNNVTNTMVLSSDITSSARLPFETLVNLNENLPKDERVFLVGAHTHQTSDGSFADTSLYYGKWNGKKKPYFEIASHNYLAESVNFFLKNSEVNSFISKPQNEFAEVEADKTYYMDVVLRDEAQMNKFAEYSGVTSSFPTHEVLEANISLEIGTNDKVTTATAVAQDNDGGAYVLWGVPEENKAYLTHTDAAGNSIDLSENFLTGASNQRYGASVAMESGSNGVYFIVGSPEVESLDTTGSIYTYRYTPSGIELLGIDSQSGHLNRQYGFGSSVDLVSGSDAVYYATCLRHYDLGPNNSTVAYGYKYKTGSFGYLNGTASPSISPSIDHYSGSCSVTIASGSTAICIGVATQHYSGSNPDFKGHWTALTSSNANPDLIVYADSYLSTYTDAAGSSKRPGITSISSVAINDPAYTTENEFFFLLTGYDWFPYAETIHQLVRITDHDPATATYVQPNFQSNGLKHLATSFGVIDYGDGMGSPSIDTPPRTGTTGTSGFEPGYVQTSMAVSDSDPRKVFISLPTGGGLLSSQEPASIKIIEVDLVTPTGSLFWLPANNPITDSEIENVLPKPGYEGATNSQPETWYGSGINLKTGPGDTLFISTGLPALNSDDGSVHLIYSAPRRDVYSQHGRLFGLPIEGAYDPAYAAYTPPGFHGERVATISFSSSVGGTISLEEVLRGSLVSDNVNVADGQVSRFSGENAILSNRQKTAKMPLASSVTLFGKTKQPNVEFQISETGEATRVDRATSAGNDAFRWAISTKYECPVLDTSSSLYAANYTSHLADENDPLWGFSGSSGQFSHPRSVWTSYGQATKPDKGYFFELRESTSRGTNDGSLVELCGFTPGTKKIGSVADNKVISEAIMVIPYTSQAIKNKTIQIEKGKHFFRLNKSELKRQKRSVEDNGYAVSEDLRETSISELVQGMKDYVIPPHYNFLKYNDIKPFACYFLEFEHTLSQRDLIDIWQGITPSIALNPETEEVEISHDINKHNLFHNIDIPSDIKFMIFKVKKQAMWNYYDITTDSTDDNRFRFDFQGDGQVEVVPDYNYNWPYDFFSLVERAKVDVDITFKKEDEEE